MTIIIIINFTKHTENPRTLKAIIGPGHIDRPTELIPLRLVVDLLDRNVVLLAPRHRDPRVQIIQFRRSQRDRLVLVPVRLLHLQLEQLVAHPLQHLLLLVVDDFFLDAAAFRVPGRVLHLPLRVLDLLAFRSDFFLEFLHGFLVALRDGPLMVAEDGDGAIRPVVRQDFFRQVVVRVRELVQLLLQRPGRVVGTEDLGGESGLFFFDVQTFV